MLGSLPSARGICVSCLSFYVFHHECTPLYIPLHLAQCQVVALCIQVHTPPSPYMVIGDQYGRHHECLNLPAVLVDRPQGQFAQ